MIPSITGDDGSNALTPAADATPRASTAGSLPVTPAKRYPGDLHQATGGAGNKAVAGGFNPACALLPRAIFNALRLLALTWIKVHAASSFLGVHKLDLDQGARSTRAIN
jgi:hypothetical protein